MKLGARSNKVSNASKLRKQLRDGHIFAAGCFDPLSAAIAQKAEFSTLYVSGFCVEATQMGAPDVGVMTMSELASHVARITATVSIPAIVDIDTGFGGVGSIMRTIAEIERAGAGGIHIEDQENPKKCPRIPGRILASEKESLGRVEAVLEARQNPDFVVIARTDGELRSFDESVRRANLYLKAGADVAMPIMTVINGKPLREFHPDEQFSWFKRLAKEVEGPIATLQIPTGHTAKDMREAGFTIVISPLVALESAASAMMKSLREAAINGTARDYFKQNPAEIGGNEVMDMLGLQDFLEYEARYGGKSVA
jgi:2-methylisocitrate lyase-like PEP mutase family enzyme